MPIAFVGDVHGCVRHALAAAVVLQRERQLQFDAVVAVGDFGLYQQADVADPGYHYLAANPAQFDGIRAMDGDDTMQPSLARAAAALSGPFLYLSGNHEDHALIADRHAAHPEAAVVPIDPGGIFGHVANGSVLHLGAFRVAFLGGIDRPGAPYDLDPMALARLAGLGPRSVDVLVTHDGPYGLCTNWRGRTQGSRRLRSLIEALAVPLHVSGHYHHKNGPRSYGPTRSYMLACLVDPKHDPWNDVAVNPDQRVSPASVGLLRDDGIFDYVRDDWLADIHGDEIDLDDILGPNRHPTPGPSPA